jgi:hypothetical protein
MHALHASRLHRSSGPGRSSRRLIGSRGGDRGPSFLDARLIAILSAADDAVEPGQRGAREPVKAEHPDSDTDDPEADNRRGN